MEERKMNNIETIEAKTKLDIFNDAIAQIDNEIVNWKWFMENIDIPNDSNVSDARDADSLLGYRKLWKISVKRWFMVHPTYGSSKITTNSDSNLLTLWEKLSRDAALLKTVNR